MSLPGRYVIRWEYVSLVEGWRAAHASLAQAVQAAGTGIHNAAEIATYAHERAAWADCMRRCSPFLGQAA